MEYHSWFETSIAVSYKFYFEFRQFIIDGAKYIYITRYHHASTSQKREIVRKYIDQVKIKL